MRRILTMLVVASALGFAGCASHPVKPASAELASVPGAGAASQGAAAGANTKMIQEDNIIQRTKHHKDKRIANKITE
jgi:hypothetical protein